jgi:CheY-like chemotaxis protein
MTVLVVDDDPVSARVLQLALEREHFHVATAASGPEALDWLAGGHPTQLVITDQNLGGMTGLDLVTTMGGDIRWRDVPVMLCTGFADRETVGRAMELGVRHFLVKPVRPAVLMEKVERILAERQPALETKYEVMERLGLSEQQYRAVADVTLRHLTALGAQLVKARSSGNAPEAMGLAGRIRESATLIGARRLTAAIAELDAAAGGPGVDPALQRVTQEVARVEEELAVAARHSLLKVE